MAEFHADGRRVFKSPIRKKEGKTTVVTIGFPICEVYEHVQHADQVAEAIAKALSEADNIQ